MAYSSPAVRTEPLPTPRILEIGEVVPFKLVLPEHTLLLWRGRERPANLDHHPFRLADLPRWLRRIRGGEFDLVVLHARQHPLWRRDRSCRSNARSIAGILRRGGRDLAGVLTRCDFDTPLLFVDFNDEPYIDAHNLAALARSRVAFKRELPLLPARVLGGPHTETWLRRRGGAAFGDHLASKLRPISVGLSAARARHAEVGTVEKTADIFWAGTLSNPVRRLGMTQLERLRADGYRVDVATAPMRHAEFMRRCAAAWLVWSPEGYGWDCFRHYEAAAVGSVPLINTPTIQRFQPLIDGEHCLYYDTEGDDLQRVVRAALADRTRLLAIGAAARTHVLRHHTHAALVSHMLAAVLDPSRFDLSAARAPAAAGASAADGERARG
jgi:hypothetical protein